MFGKRIELFSLFEFKVGIDNLRNKLIRIELVIQTQWKIRAGGEVVGPQYECQSILPQWHGTR